VKPTSVGETVRKGSALALATALISGVSIYVAKFGTQAVPDPFVYTTARNLYVGALLLGLVGLTGRWREARTLARPDWGRLALLATLGGSVPFLLFFWGLSLTSAPMASFIQKTQFLWVAALAAPLLGEAAGGWGALGLLALFAGTVLQGPMPLTSLGAGEALVLAATLLWAGEAVVARRTLRGDRPGGPPPLLGAAARMAGGAVVMVGFLAASGRLPALAALDGAQWLWVAGPGLLLLGYVLTWYHALRLAPATVVASILTIGAPVTAVLNAALVTHRWPTQPLAGGALLALGGALVAVAAWRATRALEAAPASTAVAATGSVAHAS
jgi:drug/metabolite transporter (DMT)-like permease